MFTIGLQAESNLNRKQILIVQEFLEDQRKVPAPGKPSPFAIGRYAVRKGSADHLNFCAIIVSLENTPDPVARFKNPCELMHGNTMSNPYKPLEYGRKLGKWTNAQPINASAWVRGH